MRNLLLASAAALVFAAAPALGRFAAVGRRREGRRRRACRRGRRRRRQCRQRRDERRLPQTAVDAGAATHANLATGAVDNVLAAGAATATDGTVDAQTNVQSAQTVLAAGQLIGKTVVDANGAKVGEVSNAVLRSTHMQ